MKAFLFLAEGFEEMEAIIPIDMLRRAGFDLTTVSITDSLQVTGAHHISLIADATFNNLAFETADILILPGGMPGTKNLQAHSGLQQVLHQHYIQNKWLAAICAAPSIFGKNGWLDGRNAICYPGFEKELKGATISDRQVVMDGNIITAQGAGVAFEFSLKIIGTLFSEEKADSLSKTVCLKQ